MQTLVCAEKAAPRRVDADLTQTPKTAVRQSTRSCVHWSGRFHRAEPRSALDGGAAYFVVHQNSQQLPALWRLSQREILITFRDWCICIVSEFDLIQVIGIRSVPYHSF